MERIFFNGKIITMESTNEREEREKEPEAVLIRDGIIVSTGSLLDIERYAGSHVIKTDLKGKCLMPAFIDSHSHFVMSGQMSMMANLSECESFEDIINELRNYMENNRITKEDVIIGFGYDHNFLKENAQPDKRVLDQVSAEIPIFILHVSAHLACANSAALKIAGIDENTADPEGGIIGRCFDSTEPSGYVEEAALNLLQMAIFPKVRFDIRTILQKVQEEYISNGITTVQDGASTEKDIKVLINMSEMDKLKIDVVSYLLMPNDGIQIMEKYEKEYSNYKNHFKIGGYKLVLDGSPQGRSAWMTEPYIGEVSNYKGYPWMQDETVYRYVIEAISHNKQLLAHCNGDAASDQFLNIYEKALKETQNKMDLRPVMIHCQTVRNDQLDKMAQIPMIASIFIGHVWYWGDIHIKNFGYKRGEHISPAKDALNRGVLINFHQDTPVTRPNMLHSIWCAVNRISRSGQVIGENQKINIYDALKAVTINAAYQYFEENTKGSITKGKRADLIILDKSPMDIDKMEIKNIKVIETIKDGETIYIR